MRLSAVKSSLRDDHQRLVVGVTFLCLSFLGISLLRAEEPKARATLQHGVASVVFSPDGRTLASGSFDRSIKLWDVATGKARATLQGHSDDVLSIAFSPDGKTLASASFDKTVKLWDMVTGKEQATLQGHLDRVWSVAFSDGKTLASASEDKTIKLWDVPTGKERATLQGHTDPVYSVAFNPDGKALASASYDQTVKLWDVATGKERATLQGHTGVVLVVVFSPDGKTLASGSMDYTVKMWDVATGKEQTTLQGHTNIVWAVAYSPDGKTLATGSGDQSVKMWEVVTGKERATLQGHAEPISSVAFSPDGKTLASASYDQTAKLWDIPAAKKTETTRTGRLSGKDLDGLWTTLAGEDAAQAYRGINALVLSPEQAVTLMKERLRPASEPNALLIADLDSDQFAVRAKASEALEKLGDVAEPALRKKLAEKPSLEVRQRIEQILKKIEQQPISSEAIRASRAVEVLEYIGSSEAKKVLGTLATGAEGARLTKEAKASLERLKKTGG